MAQTTAGVEEDTPRRTQAHTSKIWRYSRYTSSPGGLWRLFWFLRHAPPVTSQKQQDLSASLPRSKVSKSERATAGLVLFQRLLLCRLPLLGETNVPVEKQARLRIHGRQSTHQLRVSIQVPVPNRKAHAVVPDDGVLLRFVPRRRVRAVCAAKIGPNGKRRRIRGTTRDETQFR